MRDGCSAWIVRVVLFGVMVAVSAVWMAGCAGGDPALGWADGEAEGRPAPVRRVSAYETAVVRSVLREEAIAELEGALSSDSALLRANALEGLRWAPSRLRGALPGALEDRNAGVRFAAGMLAGEFRVRGVREELEGLLSDRDERVRMAGIYGLARLGVGVDRTPLAEALGGGDAMVRRQAVFVLGELGDGSAVPLLREARRAGGGAGGSGSDGTLLRLMIAEALMKLGESGVESVLRSALYPGSREEVEASVLAAQMIGEARVRTAIGQLVSVIEQPARGSEGVGDPREREYLWPMELRLAASLALAKMGELGGVFVADLAFDDESAVVRSQAAFVYGWAGRPIDLAKLELLMADRAALVRVAASASVLRALADGGDLAGGDGLVGGS